MKFVKWAFNKGLDIKDWRIALIYCAMVSFIAYCAFFGGVKQITDIWDNKDNVEQVQKVYTLKVK